KPPSSDGLKKPPRIAGSTRGKSGKTSGGQAGHAGDTLRPVAKPDVVERHEAQACRHCLAGLTTAMITGAEKRQVFDVPEARLKVTEHRAMIYCCAHCRGQTTASFPEGVTAPAQYGPRVRAAAVYLNVQQLLPEDRVAQAMADLFGAARLCPDSVVAWGRRKAEEFEAVAARIAALVAQAAVRHLDETGFRIAGKGQWLHTASTTALTSYRVSAKRGDLPKGLRGGVIVHDHFAPYYTLPGVRHALCNAHHLRELKALVDIDKEQWAGQMRDLLLEANESVRAAVAEGAASLPTPVLRMLIKRYNATIRRGLAFHRNLPPLARTSGARGRAPHRPGHNLLIRLHKFKSDALRFLYDFAVPFTNNEAERDLRMMKVKMKISGGFRTMAGARTFARLRSVISTARKQGWNILHTLTANPAALSQAISG
ncbi:MAG TPA: IS66 family transposase, partial [Roseiarcus sp.]|nr:IS66 family transposase [Roseiarcus sp.]